MDLPNSIKQKAGELGYDVQWKPLFEQFAFLMDRGNARNIDGWQRCFFLSVHASGFVCGYSQATETRVLSEVECLSFLEAFRRASEGYENLERYLQQ